ncbi:hypothetical protein GC425_04350 [Corynebacterium sp. zg254]|uniref:J domain-containing protein n=1 Tax=Corynebacterium zhongnanshanii TaxID=2768834 RepID=A0ABQ6VEJ7_9CORY|nr:MULTISPECIES: hypothetical protein [Corynebacterium]KAB3522829.1 hypothetical protein F8377_01270 [Corynebacterium zhongnanshanii]MCR5914102.1 hypothetical protein [Corynebacterium sp. zg254]
MENYKTDPAYIKERRRIIRQYHPDAGGSDEKLISELQKLDEHYSRTFPAARVFDSLSFLPEDAREKAEAAYRSAERWATSAAQRVEERVRPSSRESLKDSSNDSVLEDLARKAARSVNNVRKFFS